MEEKLALSPEMDGSYEYDASADEFYEEIEAPKFVDLTIKDPVRVDDCYWFCSRVGCDQKHEEELDSEEIYKNFVLRVMAARSPNVRLQKVLRRRAPIAKPKCPLSAPPKSSRSRITLISCSINQKLADIKAKATEALPGASEKTPVAKAKKTSVVAAKYMTTPRNKKCAPRQDLFLSVQNPKAPCLAESKSRVTKALVFHSPRKAVKLKASLELKTPVRKACERLKKVDDESQRKRILGYSPKTSSAVRPKIIRPWRVNNSGQRVTKKCVEEKKKECQDSIGHKVGSLKSKKRKSKVVVEVCEKIERAENHSAEVEQAVLASKEDKASPEKSSSDLPSELEVELKPEVSEDGKASDDSQASELHGGIVTYQKGQPQEEVLTESETEDTLKEPGSELPNKGIDATADKENESVPDHNRCNSSAKGANNSGRKSVGLEDQPHKKILKVTKTAFAAPGTQGMKYSKPKPTNPKPFRLRTAEREILKDANLDKRVRLVTPLRMHESALQIDKCPGEMRSKSNIKKAIETKPCKKTAKLESSVIRKVQDVPVLTRTKTPSSVNLPVEHGKDNTAQEVACKPEKPKSILSSAKQKTATPSREKAKSTTKPKVSFMIPGEKTPEVCNVHVCEKTSNTSNTKKSPSKQRSLTPVASCLRKPKSSAWKLP